MNHLFRFVNKFIQYIDELIEKSEFLLDTSFTTYEQ